MAKDVIMPVLGMNQDTAVLLAWLKREGDAVREGEPLMEVETDKATMELDAPASGRLADVSAVAGDEVRVGSVIARIVREGEEPAGAPGLGAAAGSDDTPAAGPPAAGPPAAGPPAAGPPSAGRSGTGTPQAGPASTERPSTERPSTHRSPAGTGPARPAPAGPAAGRSTRLMAASPKARRLAAEANLDLVEVTGSGPHGAVLALDVARALDARPGSEGAGAGHAHPGRTPGTEGAGTTGAARAPTLDGVLPAAGLRGAVARVRRLRRGDAVLSRTEPGDVVARLVSAAWSAGRTRGIGGGLTMARVADGSAVRYGAPPGAGLRDLVQARIAASQGGEGAAGAEPTADEAGGLAIVDLGSSRIDRAAATALAPAGAAATLVLGRVPGEERGDTLTLTFSFDPARLDALEAAAFFDRVLGLVEDPASLLLLA